MTVISATLERFLLGPFADLRRFVTGGLQAPPPTRKIAPEELAAARAVLTAVGCDLTPCTGENLHTAIVPLPANEAYDLFLDWQTWPRSGFFACLDNRDDGSTWFSYRFYKLIPIVTMRLKVADKPNYIIYDIVSGIGAGGYHSFLFQPDPVDPDQSIASIFTIFPPTLFLTGLHDQTNLDIYRKLNA